jgi:hypothetical protein
MNSLKLIREKDMSHSVEVWIECASVEEVDDLIAWLELISEVMVAWQERMEARSSAPAQLRKIKQG